MFVHFNINGNVNYEIKILKNIKQERHIKYVDCVKRINAILVNSTPHTK